MPLPSSSGFDSDFSGPVEWAQMYRDHGLQVVPGYMPGEHAQWKRPALADWKPLHDELAPDFTFARWYGETGEHTRRKNIGLIAGPCSGNIFVIDLDTHKHPSAAAWWSQVLWGHNGGDELKTWSQTTGGGGRQLFFRAPAEWRAPTNRTPVGVDIRGYAGYAVLPPSLHDSGREYRWDKDLAPYDGLEVMDAPDWLLAAVEDVVSRHGTRTPGAAPTERTASPASDFDGFGNQIDGREDRMTREVWKAVVAYWRECPIGPPPEIESTARMVAAYEVYERGVSPRTGDGSDKAGALNREGRGSALFAEKWRRAIRQWDDKVAEAGRAPKPGAEQASPPPDPDPVKIDPETGKPVPLILSASEFVKGFTPPDYLIDGMLQRGYLYSLTARTGHGKTAVAMFIGQAVARNEAIKGREVKQGSVLFLAGENPDDIRARFLVLADKHGFSPADVPFHFIAGVIDVAASLPRIREEAAKIPDLMLVIVDTAAAYFRGDDGNSNVQQGAYARVLRELSFLPGKPAVLVNSHPVKNAGRDNLSPVGGGAFLNEVDGNLTLWANADGQTTLHWQGKFRGPEFDPITFKLETVTCPAVHDSHGELIPSVVAVPISDMEQEAGERHREANEDIVLTTLSRHPSISIARLATLCRFVSETGQPQKSKTHRVLRDLTADKLVEVVRNKYRLTAKGKNEVAGDDE